MPNWTKTDRSEYRWIIEALDLGVPPGTQPKTTACPGCGVTIVLNRHTSAGAALFWAGTCGRCVERVLILNS